MADDLDAAHAAERLAVAMRMLRFAARTSTIYQATGLSDEQIRRLYHRGDLAGVSNRHRGRSPSSASQFTRTLTAQLQSSIFSGALMHHGLIKGRRARPWLDNALQYAARFCDAYTEYLQIAEQDALGFDHAWYLARTLAVPGELYLQRCCRCASHFVRDHGTVLRQHCPFCQLRELTARSKPGGELLATRWDSRRRFRVSSKK